ncbi:hypothetical protein SLS60_011048 [Paraconiothyrium brasiliense]|uniref:Methyltransferase n=1 Tax=Paraconiothyrium brasiliense TaxID=300254 RepID=A0ABR3QLB6_9PLEO
MTTEQGDYILQSGDETKRLATQHYVIKDEAGGLILAPLDLSTKPLRILDSATADGTWIRDLAQQYSGVPHEFIGTDIDTSAWPRDPPSHQTYQIQDITKPWPAEWKEGFDFVHQRLALAAGGPIQKHIVSHLGDLVKPGGWIQLIEASNETHESHGPAFRNFVTIIKSIYTVFNGSLKLCEEIPVWLKEAGFVDIGYRDIDTKLGALNPDPVLAKQGVYSTTIAARGLVHFGSTLPVGAIPLSPEQIVNNPDDLNAELAKTGAVYPLRIVWARKPEA